MQTLGKTGAGLLFALLVVGGLAACGDDEASGGGGSSAQGGHGGSGAQAGSGGQGGSGGGGGAQGGSGAQAGSSSGGGGAGGAGPCSSCADWLESGGELCPRSVSLADDVYCCACGEFLDGTACRGGVCMGDCTPNFCAGEPMSSDCESCLTSLCDAAYADCLAD